MTTPRRIQFRIVGTVAVLLALALAWAFSGAFDTIDYHLSDAKYRVRGEIPTDTSVVIVYFDNDDIAALGGLPLRRSYYALLLTALHHLGARAIGIDIGLTEPDRINPEYDDLLASTIQQSGNVVTSGYFRSFSSKEQANIHPTQLPDQLTYTLSHSIATAFPVGNQIETPVQPILEHAEAFGHTNLSDGLSIPLFIKHVGEKFVPSFGLELLRLSVDAERSDVSFDDRTVRITTRSSGVVHIPFDARGEASINISGGMNSLQLYPAVAFLHGYDVLQSGGTPDLPIRSIRGKTVIVSIIAEGRSMFVTTPFAPQFPSAGIHALFLDNALRGSFVRRSPQAVVYACAALVGLLCVVAMSSRRELNTLVGIGTLLTTALGISFALFVFGSYELPVARTIFAGFAVSVTLLAYKHQIASRDVDVLAREKESISALLIEKEAELHRLESEFAQSQLRHEDIRSVQLQGEIQKFRDEILRLKSQAEDLQPFAAEPNPNEISELHEFGGMLYSSVGPMREIVDLLRKIADTDASILILGESGTGKELVARALHNHSARKDCPFVAVNCGALSETLLESELFGHEKGAFTGALKEKPGRFELANNGTIFLDEIGETTEAFQVKLLRVLQDGTFERVGGTETRRVNVRVVAATNRDLKQAVEAKTFREDLYYRLNVFTVHIPALRDRVDDIPHLVQRFVAQEDPTMRVSASVMAALRQHAWRGNIRELQSVVKRAVLLARADGRNMLRLKDLDDEIARAASNLDLEQEIVQSLRERKFSRSAISETAQELGGLNRGTVAEYFRGYCFKTIVESRWNTEGAAATIACSSDPEVVSRVGRKLNEYLANAVELVDQTKNFAEVQQASRPKYKNLPQRYHPFLDEVIASFHRGEWTIPSS
jgi:transcriptional regulator with PAS, ATPase and Fis domain/CHASE2 domain-containing sensor protein